MKHKIYLLIILIFTIKLAQAQYTTVTWTAAGGDGTTGSDHNWNVASNWNPQRVPDATCDVVIPHSLAAYFPGSCTCFIDSSGHRQGHWPSLQSNVIIHSLTIVGGSTTFKDSTIFDSNGWELTTTGSINIGANTFIWDSYPGVRPTIFNIQGSGGNINGTKIEGDLIIKNGATTGGNTYIDALYVPGNFSLYCNGPSTIGIGGSTIFGTSVFEMNNPLGTIIESAYSNINPTTGNHYYKNVYLYQFDSGTIRIANAGFPQYDTDLTIIRQGKGAIITSYAGGKPTIKGNLLYLNNGYGGITNFGYSASSNIATSVNGDLSITSTGSGHEDFSMYNFTNNPAYSTSSTINLASAGTVNMQGNVLNTSLINISGIQGNYYSNLWYNQFTGNFNLADDSTNTWPLVIGGNTFLNNFSVTHNSPTIIYESYTNGNASPGNHVLGNTILNENSTAGFFKIAFQGSPKYDGNLTINRLSSATITTSEAASQPTIGGNFYYNNAGLGGTTNFGNSPASQIATQINGSLNIAVTGSGHEDFSMYNFRNNLATGSFNLANAGTLSIKGDTLASPSFNISGIKGNYYSNLWYNQFTGNFNLADDSTNTWPLVIGGNTFLNNLSLTHNSPIIFYESYTSGNTSPGNHVLGNTILNENSTTGSFKIAYTGSPKYDGNLTINRLSSATITTSEGAGQPTIGGNFYYNNAGLGGTTNFGYNPSSQIATQINGSLNIAVTGSGHEDFSMYNFRNNLATGSFNLANAGTLNIKGDTLASPSFNISGIKGNYYSNLWYNQFTGNFNLADDSTNTWPLVIGGNTFLNNLSLTHNSPIIFYESYTSGNTSPGNHVLGNTILNENSTTGIFKIAFQGSPKYDGNLTINRLSSAKITTSEAAGQPTIGGNFYYNNAGLGGTTNFGYNPSSQIATQINGSLNIAVTGSGHETFSMYNFRNNLATGSFNLANAGTLSIKGDSLASPSFNISGIKGNYYSNLWYNQFTGNFNLADDSTNTWPLVIGGNTFLNSLSVTHNSPTIIYESYTNGNASPGNYVLGNALFSNLNAAGIFQVGYGANLNIGGDLALHGVSGGKINMYNHINVGHHLIVTKL